MSLLQCHGAAEEALASTSTNLKGLLALPAQAAQVHPINLSDFVPIANIAFHAWCLALFTDA